MKRLLLSASLLALASAAHAGIFNDGTAFDIQTTNSPTSSSATTVLFTPGLTQFASGVSLELTLSVVNAANYSTTGAQWLVFNYQTAPAGTALSQSNQDWGITAFNVPFNQPVNFIADFTQWTVDGSPTTQFSSIFHQALESNPVPGGTGNGEGTNGFVDMIPVGPNNFGAFADPFSQVIAGLTGLDGAAVIPTGFTQALEFGPTSFAPGTPELPTWAMGIAGFGFLAFFGFKRRVSMIGA